MPILRLDEIGAADLPRVGGKAFVLAQLKKQGFAVPDGFVLTADVSFDAAAKDALLGAYRKLGGAVAVRSSSTAEDLAGASFAGQYQTLLDVRDEPSLAAAVERCLASAADGAAYAEALGTGGTGRMAVLVQRFVEPRLAGVAFTRHPADASALLVESHAGRGEPLVAGRVTPERHVVDLSSGAVRERPAQGGLRDDELAAVVRLAREAEARLGGAQDVEWAIGPAGLVLLQSRPITVAAETSDPRARRLTRANVGEVLPDPVTPLTWSTVCTLLESGFLAVAREAGLLPRGFRGGSFLVLHHRRLYLNLSLCVEVARRLPGITAADTERLILGAGASKGSGVPLRLSALPALARVALRLLALERRLPRYVVAAQAIVAGLPSRESVLNASPELLLSLVRSFLATGEDVARTHIAASGSSAFRLALLTRVVAAWLPGDPADLVNRLVAGLPDVESAAPTLALEKIAAEAGAQPEWRAWLAQEPQASARALAGGEIPASLGNALRGFLARFGHRAVSEGELSAPSWEDDPTPLLAALQTLVAGSRPAGFGHRARASDRRADEAAARHRLGPIRGAIFAWLLRGAQEWVRQREKTKSLAIGLVAHGRRLARASARLLVRRGSLASETDVFLLTLDEIAAALQGPLPSPPEIARRRRRQEREAALPAPREVDLDASSPEHEVAASWVGLGASPGIGVGRARVLGAGVTPHLEPGEVLVAPVLDAALGPLLAAAAGAVAEVGGMLSHGSVVARELGVPCVVDLREATRRIRTGELVVVDGSSGRVRVVSDEANANHPSTPASSLPVADPADERLHALERHPKARESVYFNAYDPEAGVGIIASLGVRPGDRGEAVLALSLPDGRTLFALAFARPRCDATGFGVAGIGAAWRPARFFFRGRLAAWGAGEFPPDPLPLLLAPRTVEVDLELAFHPASPAVDLVAGLSEEARGVVLPLGRHHVEQSGVFRGHVRIDGRRLRLEATGSRDHSWGLRDWSAADHWKLFTVRFGDDLTLHALTTSVNGRRLAGGFLWREGRVFAITRVECAHEPGAERLDLEVQTEGGERLALRGMRQRSLTIPVELERRPLRHLAGSPYALALRENFTRYEAVGRVAYGIAEFAERPEA